MAAFGFECRCCRCQQEEDWPIAIKEALLHAQELQEQPHTAASLEIIGESLDRLQVHIASMPPGKGGALGMAVGALASVAPLYFDLLNLAGINSKSKFDTVMQEREGELLALDIDLSSVAGGGTEQLSLAHTMVDSQKEASEKAAYWVLRLHAIHRIRFGTETARAVAHTRQLTRHPDGFQRIRHPFL